MSGRAALACLLAVVSTFGCMAAAALVFLGQGWAAAVVIGLPILGGSAVFLGWLALRDIRASGGRLTGRVPALVGMFLGLMSAVTQGSFGVGAMLVYSSFPHSLRPVVQRLFIAMDRAESAAAGSQLSPSTQAPTPERLDRVGAELHRRLGRCLGAEFDLSVVMDSRRFASTLVPAPGSAPATTEAIKPARVVYEKGAVLVLTWLDNAAMNNDEIRVLDALVVLDNPSAGPGAEVIALSENGPASAFASAYSMRTFEPSLQPTSVSP